MKAFSSNLLISFIQPIKFLEFNFEGNNQNLFSHPDGKRKFFVFWAHNIHPHFHILYTIQRTNFDWFLSMLFRKNNLFWKVMYLSAMDWYLSNFPDRYLKFMKENEEFNESMLIQTSKKYVLCPVKFILRFFSFIKNKRMSIISFKKK